MAAQLFNFAGNHRCFALMRCADHDLHRLVKGEPAFLLVAAVAPGLQWHALELYPLTQRLHRRVLIDGGKSDLENVAARALVFIQYHALSLGKALLEFFKGRAGRSATTVDRLGRIADGEEVLFLPG